MYSISLHFAFAVSFAFLICACGDLLTTDQAPVKSSDRLPIDPSQQGFTAFKHGSGEIPHILGEKIQIEESRKIKLIFLSEGYLDSDLAIFADDVKDWYAEASEVEPFKNFSEAFDIWLYSKASHEHLLASDSNRADTAFKVPLSQSGGIASQGFDDMALKLWEVLVAFGGPSQFYPQGGVTDHLAKDLLVVILTFDAEKGRSGRSGRMRLIANPNDSKQRVAVAMGHHRIHEFLHGFTRLHDEYLEDDSKLLGVEAASRYQSSSLSNVVSSPQCQLLPWQHLLKGGAINPRTDQLIGAFGNPQNGYHSELKCLMNGSHDNQAYFGGNGYLRTTERLCNFCRELTIFRLYERLGLLDGEDDSYGQWETSYRQPFYQKFPFDAPETLPMENNEGKAIFHSCSDS